MPIFPFRCECGNEFETLVGMTQDSSTSCPTCGSDKTERQVQSSVGHQTMYDTKNLDPREVAIMRRHKEHIEHHMKETGRIVDFDASKQKLREFHPEVPRKFY